jgi:hypothetical protein
MVEVSYGRIKKRVKELDKELEVNELAQYFI